MLNGIDISSWQGDIDLSYMKNLGCDFVITKATEGVHYVNPWCDKKVQEAKSLDMLWGFYHFAGGYDSAYDEAAFFVDNCKNYFGEGIPVLDFEGHALEQGAEWAIKFLDYVEQQTAVKPLIYMSQSVTKWQKWREIKDNNGLWVALYPNVTAPGFDYSPEFPTDTGQWEYPAIWQYASDGFGYLDINHAYMTKEAWNKYVSPNNAVNAGNEKALTETLENANYKITIERK